MSGRWLGIGVCALVFAAAAASSEAVEGSNLTIYSSLPRQGASRSSVLAIENGARMALDERGGKVGKYSVTYRPLDDSKASLGAADEAQARKNAETASNDATAVGYIGEYNSSISKVSIPILNKAGIAQVSPSNTYNGLTISGPGAVKGEPDKYYPTGRRTYARLQPNDVVQARALATAAREDGCKSVHVFNSGTVYSRGLAKNVVRAAKGAGPTLSASVRYDPRSSNYRALAKKVKAPCVVVTGEIESNGTQLLKDVVAARPGVRLYGGDGLCLDDTGRGLSKGAAKRFRCTIAALAPGAYPQAGRDFFARYSARYGAKNPDPNAVYGYESMALLLDSIQRALPASGGPYQDPNASVSRDGVVAALFATRDRDSVLGRYGIDANGDTTLTDYGLYRIKSKRLRFDRVLQAAP